MESFLFYWCRLQPLHPKHNILSYYKIGGKVIYDEAEIEDWLEANYHLKY